MSSDMTYDIENAAQQVKFMNDFAHGLRAQNKVATDVVTDVLESNSRNKKDVPMILMKLGTLKTDLEQIADMAGEIIDETASALAYIEEILADSEDCDKGNTIAGIQIYEEGAKIPVV